MGFNFGAFAAGFATQAQKIEEESAKMGMDLIKEAIEDFREESKDWKDKYNTELKDWELLAGRIRDMVGDDAKAIAVLRKGKPYASDWAKTAVDVAKARGHDSPADLVDFGEATLPKNIDVMDWVRSGAPDMSLEAKPVLDKGMFEQMKTGVFKRQIYPEGMGRIDRTEQTYLDTPDSIRKDVIPEATFTDIYSTIEVPGQRSGPQTKSLRTQVVAQLAQGVPALAGLTFDINTGSPIYTDAQAPAVRVVNRHADAVMSMAERQIKLQRSKGLDQQEALTDTEILNITRNFMSGDFEFPEFEDTKEQIKNFYTISDALEEPNPQLTGGNQGGNQQQQQPQQTGGTIKSVTSQIANDPSVANLVTLPSNWQSMGLPKGKGARRQAIAQALIKLGVDPTVADQYSQTVTLN